MLQLRGSESAGEAKTEIVVICFGNVLITTSSFFFFFLPHFMITKKSWSVHESVSSAVMENYFKTDLVPCEQFGTLIDWIKNTF